jgi:glycosyltransferase involved in cell wall biosynthesis
MKIAYVITRSDSIGGAQVHLLYLARSMLAKGYDVKVFVGGEGPFVKELKKYSIPFVSLSKMVKAIHPVKDGKVLKNLTAHLVHFNPDVLALHSSKAGWIGRIIGKRLDIPTVFTVHGWSFTHGKHFMKRRAWLIAEKMVGNLAKQIITVSDFDRNLALKYHVSDSHKVVTIYNGIGDIPLSLIANPGKAPPRMMMVARFDKQKNQTVLLKSLARLKHLDWSLELIGEGPSMGVVQQLCSELNLKDRVVFSGFCDNVEEKLSQAQIFALTTNWEGLPISIIEAMRAGLPVAASDVGGISELVADGGNGFLIQGNTIPELTNKLQKLILDSGLRTKMGEKGREMYLNTFALDKMVMKTLSIYEEMTDDG